MYKKLLTIFIIAVFLITSVGVVSAADSISVKVVWDDHSQADHVTVKLIKDGQVVDSASLSPDNSKTTFKVDDASGNYKVTEEISSDYSYSVSGNASTGFIISNKLVKQDVLSASDDEPVLDDDTPDDKVSSNEENNEIAETDAPVTSDNGTGETGDGNSNNNDTNNNSTDNNSTDNNSTDDKPTDDSSKNKTDSNSKKPVKKTTTTTTKTTTSKVVKKENKKPENKTKTKHKNTGFPVAVLVLAVFVAAFVPFSRKK
ncbi:hypothetical protein [Methanobrevibacter sp.]